MHPFLKKKLHGLSVICGLKGCKDIPCLEQCPIGAVSMMTSKWHIYQVTRCSVLLHDLIINHIPTTYKAIEKQHKSTEPTVLSFV
jgi:Na+-translocating ferredoxin:NAD+ oxidoreductase RNF subunit RnfB